MYFAFKRHFHDSKLDKRCFHGKCPSTHVYHVGSLDAEAKARLCARRPFSFTFVRNPFDRLYSAYLGKIRHAKPEEALEFGQITQEIRRDQGLAPNATIQFPHFVRWVGNQPMNTRTNVHWQDYNTRCHTKWFNYSYIGRLEDGYVAQARRVLDQAGVDPDAFPVQPKNARQGPASSNREAAARRRAHYRCPTCVDHHELYDIAERLYRGDINMFAYHF